MADEEKEERPAKRYCIATPLIMFLGAAGKSRSWLAAQLGESPSRLQQWAQDGRYVSEEDVARVCAALDVPAEEFLATADVKEDQRFGAKTLRFGMDVDYLASFPVKGDDNRWRQ